MMSRKMRFLPFSIAILFIIISTTIFSFNVSAEDTYTNIEGADVNIEIPNELPVKISEDNKNSNDFPKSIKYTNDEGNKILEIKYEQTDVSKDLYNFKYLAKDKIDEELNNLRSNKTNICNVKYDNVTAVNTRENKGCLMFLIYYKELTEENHAVAYTIVNGYIITVDYTTTTEGLSTKDKNTFNNIVDSISISNIYEKPEKLDFRIIYKQLITVAVVIGVVTVLILIAYYVTHRSVNIETHRQVADKYYDELQREGLMDEEKTQKEENIFEEIMNIQPDPLIPPESPDDFIDEAGPPSLIKDEWEDIDLEKMFPKTNIKVKPNINRTKINGELISENQFANVERISSSQPGRADSAKRYAKMFIGSDINRKQGNNPEYDAKMAEIEERYRRRHESKNSNRKHRYNNSSNNPKSGERKYTGSISKRNSQVPPRKTIHNNDRNNIDVFGEFETDSYWNKYR